MATVTPDNSRLLAKLVRGLLADATFDTLADLTDALKCRCARLQIGWTTEDINGAYHLIASNRPLVGIGVGHHETMASFKENRPPMTRTDAAAVLRHLGLTV